MKKRTARRLALMRHGRWLLRHHPHTTAPPCLIRRHNRWVRRKGRKVGFVVPDGWEYDDLWADLGRRGDVIPTSASLRGDT